MGSSNLFIFRPSRDRIGPERDDSIFYKGMFTPVLREASTLHLPGGDDDDNPLLTNAQLLEAIFFIGNACSTIMLICALISFQSQAFAL